MAGRSRKESQAMTAKPLSAEEESALRKLCESVRCGWCEQRHEMNRLFTTLDASRAETAALKERQREAVSEIVSSYEAHGDTGALIRLAVEACCDDLKTMPGTSSQLPLFRDGFNHGVACAVARLRATFLPKDPSNG